MSARQFLQETVIIERAVPRCRRARCNTEKFKCKHCHKLTSEDRRKQSSSHRYKKRSRSELKRDDYVLKKHTKKMDDDYSLISLSPLSVSLNESSKCEQILSDNNVSFTSSDIDYLEALIKRTKKREKSWTLSENFCDDQKTNGTFQAIMTSTPITIYDSDDTGIMDISIQTKSTLILENNMY